MGTKTIFFVFVLATAARALAQMPDGSDINQAVPIWFGQNIHDIGDVNTAPLRVYSIPLAKGQQFSATLTNPSTDPGVYMGITLLPPTARSVAGCGWNCATGSVASDSTGVHSASFTYTVPAGGTYYVKVGFGSVGVNYNLQVKAGGTPIVTPLPPTAGCLTGQVDYVTYSVQLIAMGLPDEVSIGGVVACNSSNCQVKPPAYAEIVSRLESALKSQVPVSACYDSTGNIIQLKVMHP
jgi:hypothetical protein